MRSPGRETERRPFLERPLSRSGDVAIVTPQPGDPWGPGKWTRILSSSTDGEDAPASTAITISPEFVEQIKDRIVLAYARIVWGADRATDEVMIDVRNSGRITVPCSSYEVYVWVWDTSAAGLAKKSPIPTAYRAIAGPGTSAPPGGTTRTTLTQIALTVPKGSYLVVPIPRWARAVQVVSPAKNAGAGGTLTAFLDSDNAGGGAPSVQLDPAAGLGIWMPETILPNLFSEVVLYNADPLTDDSCLVIWTIGL